MAGSWRTPVGDKYILDGMLVSGAGVGGEKSGHVIVREHTSSGDGIVTALEVLDILARTGRTLSELAARIPLYPQEQRTIPARHKDQWEADLRLVEAVRTARGGADRSGPHPGPPVGHRGGAAHHGRGRGRRARHGARRPLAALAKERLNRSAAPARTAEGR